MKTATLESRLHAIDELLHSAETGIFSEETLLPLVFELIEGNEEIPQKMEKLARRLLERVCALNKSTYFGCHFYRKLTESSLPFSQETFRSAVYNEPYYNCKGDALKGFLIVTLRNNGFTGKNIIDYLDGEDINAKLEEPLPKKEHIKDRDWNDLREAIIQGIRCRSPFMMNTAILGTLVLRDFEINTFLQKELTKYIKEQFKYAEQQDVPFHAINVSHPYPKNIALALYKITGNKIYQLAQKLFEEKERVYEQLSNMEKEESTAEYKALKSQIEQLLS